MPSPYYPFMSLTFLSPRPDRRLGRTETRLQSKANRHSAKGS